MSIEQHGTATPFDSIRKTDEGGEYWSARELMRPLGYGHWRRFADAIERAKLTCENSGHEVDHHFAGAVKSDQGRQAVSDYRLTRYAAYLVAMNGDPRKPEIAAAQTYFAVRTREAEIAAVPQPRSQLDVLAAAVAELQRIEQESTAAREAAERAELVALDAVQDARVANARLDAIEGRHDYYAALGWARITGWTRTDDKTLASLGRIAGTIGRNQGIEAGEAPHARYGTVNTWPTHVWDEAARRFGAA